MSFYRCYLTTKLSPEEVIAKLHEKTDVRSDFVSGLARMLDEKEFEGKNKVWVGKITDNTFKIYRFTRSRNSFIPKIYGKVIPNSSQGCNIKLTIILHPLVIAMLTAFFVLILLFPSRATPSIYKAVESVVGIIVVISAVFYFDVFKVKKLLQEQLNTY